MFIYRVEDPEYHCGPYTKRLLKTAAQNELSEMLLTAHDDDTYLDGVDTHPDIFEDCKINKFSDEAEEYHTGCKSPKQLYTWFTGFWNDLYSVGYVLRIYDCPDTLVQSGTFQVAFLPRYSTLLDEMSITAFLDIAGAEHDTIG